MADIPCLTAQLDLRDIHDVGLKSPQEVAGFFQRSSFDADPAGSIPMTLSLDRFHQRSSQNSWAVLEQRLRTQHLYS